MEASSSDALSGQFADILDLVQIRDRLAQRVGALGAEQRFAEGGEFLLQTAPPRE